MAMKTTAHTLFTIIGRGRLLSSEETGPRRYDTTVYEFPDGHRVEHQLFGLALLQYLRTRREGSAAPTRLVMMGTTGSSWDALALDLADRGDTDALVARAEQLFAAAQDAVTQDMLDPLATAMTEGYGLECRARLIPYGRSKAEMVQTLRLIDREVADGSRVSFDLTHGLRHLPVLGLLSAMVVQQSRTARIGGVWYGAHELRRSGATPVFDLKELLGIADWVTALACYDRTGDVRVFRAVLEQDQVDRSVLGCLVEAGHYDRVNQISRAHGPARAFLDGLPAPLTGISGLFEQDLRRHLAWAGSELRLVDRQRARARAYLAHQDFLRAALAGYEGYVTGLVQAHNQRHGSSLDPMNYRHRTQALNAFDPRAAADAFSLTEGDADQEAATADALRKLIWLRNALAHGTPVRHPELVEALRSPTTLEAYLTALLDTLFTDPPWQPPAG